MSPPSDIWALPGPAGYIRDIARLATESQHVVAVLPRRLVDDLDISDALAGALIEGLDDSRRLYPLASEGTLVESLGSQAVDGFGEAPTTLSELLAHGDVAGRVFVLVGTDLEATHLAELPRFLQRLEEASRPIPPDQRGTFVVIAGHAVAPEFAGKESSDVGLTSLWFWNRIARWDVAAFLATIGVADSRPAIVRETLTEAIIEVARWNLDHAHQLATTWSGAEGELRALADGFDVTLPGDLPTVRSRRRPPDAMLDAWDAGAYECWHDRQTVSPLVDKSQRERMSRHLWSAQARVLLPWIEVRRSEVEAVVRAKLGDERMATALEQTHPERREHAEHQVPPEIGQLRAIIRARFGKTEPRLVRTVDALWIARNKLAHLEPLALSSLESLVEACAWLGP